MVENVRLHELVAVAHRNRAYYDEFVSYLDACGYASVHAFVNERRAARALKVIRGFLERKPSCPLYDGGGDPYSAQKAAWYFMGWLFRDAASQRLEPLVRQMPGDTVTARRAELLNRVRMFVRPIFPEPECWEWTPLREVMIQRLEGSRRAKRGSALETVVRGVLSVLVRPPLTVEPGQVRLQDQTYDVQVTGPGGVLLLPVKTRETMGGGHASLFTRDISESIAVASAAGYHCLPVVIAESWAAPLEGLACDEYVYVALNPNQAGEVKRQLRRVLVDRLARLMPLLASSEG